MVNIKQFAKEYTPTQRMKNITDLERMKNITDLEIVRADIEIKQKQNADKMFITVDGEEYRIPILVIEQLNAIIKTRPELTHFSVTKTGQVIPYDQ